MRQGLKGLLLWGLIIGGTIVLCVALFPDLKKEFGDMVDAMADMGGFGAAFGMKSENRRNFEAGIFTDEEELVNAAIAHFDEVWMGKPCKTCGRKDVCKDRIA